MNDLAKLFILLGIFFLAAGVLVMVAHKVPWLGRLPGDIVVRKRNVTFYFPLMTSLLASLVLSLIIFLFNRR